MKEDKRLKILKTILLIIFAEIGNLLVVLAGWPFRLPVFLDTVFTVAITFYTGLIPGLIVAAAYNPLIKLLIYIISHEYNGIYSIFYALCGMLIVVVTWLFSRKKDDFLYSRKVTFLYLLVISFASAFASSFCGAFLDTVIRPFYDTPELTSSETFFQNDPLSYLFSRLGFGAFLSFLLPRIPITVLDRIICTFAGFGVYKLYSRIVNGGGEESK